ncbi:hypothetical protein U728_1524 [Clostridium botulinum 202F]|nr:MULTISPECIES: DUF86 domain-containing protein [unclassified Clostridium]AIY78957.1 hypothetical protein U728_1524 [Clostridium botulinum 202F]KAI3346717.1 DUF86 domain-containing protein [Clostridium botulinum]
MEFDNKIIDEKDVLIYFNMAKFRNRIVHMYFKNSRAYPTYKG